MRIAAPIAYSALSATGDAVSSTGERIQQKIGYLGFACIYQNAREGTDAIMSRPRVVENPNATNAAFSTAEARVNTATD